MVLLFVCSGYLSVPKAKKNYCTRFHSSALQHKRGIIREAFQAEFLMIPTFSKKKDNAQPERPESTSSIDLNANELNDVHHQETKG